jgi:hypothetical protein
MFVAELLRGLLSSGVEREVAEMLLPGEQVLLVAEQSRVAPGGSFTTPNKIYVTNRRVIFRNPRLLGLKADLNDFSYQDIANIRMHRGVFSTEIFLKSRFLSDEVVLPAVDKDTARRVNEYIRKGMMNQLPGQVISERATAPVVEAPAATKDPLADLERLYSLKEKGAITAEEFEKMKATLLGTGSSTQQQTPPAPAASSADSSAGFCPQCGAKQKQLVRFCSQCGAEIGRPRPEATPA